MIGILLIITVVMGAVTATGSLCDDDDCRDRYGDNEPVF